MIEAQSHDKEEIVFGEFRKKMRSADLLCAAMQKLLQAIQFNGRLSVIVQNGRILKSGYEEGYFRRSESALSSTTQ